MAHPDDRPALARAWASAREHKGRPSAVEIRAVVDGAWKRIRIDYLDATAEPSVGVVLIGVRVLGDAELADPIPASTLGDAEWVLLQIGPVGDIVAAEGHVEAMYGATAEQLVGRNGLDMIHPDDHAPLLEAWVGVVEGREPGRALRQRIIRSDGSVRWALTSISRPDPAGPVVVHDLDLSPQLAAEAAAHASDERFRLLADEVPAAVFVGSTDGRIHFANRRLLALLDVAELESVAELLSDEDTRRWPDHVAAASAGGSVELETASPAGPVLRVRCQAPGDGTVVGVVEDISLAVRLRDEARIDGLTGLLNRAAIHGEIALAIAAGAPGTVVAFVDLDDFKTVNDRFGHTVGDRVLHAVAARLRDAIRPGDRLGRWGGDEFVVVAEGIDVGDEASFRERVVRTVAGVDAGSSGETGVHRVSIGMTRVLPNDDVETVVTRADAEMYAHKRAARPPG
jgi:diguanylate cyclase (GGDEF)-like protein/PAS domain S-box-containing protein